MNHSRRRYVGVTLGAAVLLLAGCETTDGERVGGELVLGGYGNDDDELSVAVRDALRGHPETAIYNISVGNNDGTITLGGYVDNHGERDTAERVAAAVDGVDSVVNTLYLK